MNRDIRRASYSRQVNFTWTCQQMRACLSVVHYLVFNIQHRIRTLDYFIIDKTCHQYQQYRTDMFVVRTIVTMKHESIRRHHRNVLVQWHRRTFDVHRLLDVHCHIICSLFWRKHSNQCYRRRPIHFKQSNKNKNNNYDMSYVLNRRYHRLFHHWNQHWNDISLI
jgi:hypothetical protein